VGGFFHLKIGFWGLAASGAVVLCAFTAAGFFGRLWWWFDLAANFRVQYLLCLLLTGVIFVIRKRWPWAVVCGVFALVNFLDILPSFVRPSKHPVAPSKSARILLANVLTSNKQYDKVRNLIRSVHPDIVAVLEVSEAWMKELSSLDEYPHVISRSREDNLGIALLSRVPFEEAEIVELGDSGVPSAVARLRIEGKQLTVIATHPLPPIGSARFRLRNRQLLAVADYVRSLTSPVIVLGDFNTTPWSPHFKRLLRRANLRDSRRGQGIHPSWPSDLPWLLRIPLDHILHSGEITILSRQLCPPIGSDHLSVVVDFSLASDRSSPASSGN
jgi:endonuclease/exonuclease/phosphatase (EEP) superfamily protein YafD